MVREILKLFSPRPILGGMPPKLHMQAVALLHGSRVVFHEKPIPGAADNPYKGMIPYQPRLTYAEAQSKWEWEHNKAARDAYQRQKDGFF